MQEQPITRLTTGIASLDPILEGGIPAGSLVLLMGEIGGGSYEFVYSSLVNTLAGSVSPADASRSKVLPRGITYVTFTRLKDDILREIAESFPNEKAGNLAEKIAFVDLSEIYFDSSIVPDDWYSRSDVLTRLHQRAGREDLFVRLADIINTAQDGSLVIFDSVTDIATQESLQKLWGNLTGFLRGLQRISKQRGITIYFLLTKGILEASRELELSDIADAVLLFRWEQSAAARRQRVMYFEKFRGVMPHLEEQDLVKFSVKISTTGGFEVSNIRVVI